MEARIEQIWTLAEPVARELGVELLDVEFAGASQRQLVRIYLDRPGGTDGVTVGVTVEDCVAVSRRLGDVLEAHEALEGRYMLEVSSPGLNRPLRLPEHFMRFVGECVRVKLRRDREERRQFTGELVEANETRLVLDCDGEKVGIAYAEIDRANIEYQFEDPTPPGRKKRGK
ncbi:MAG: ribosome maturation factor RimP [Hyphomicrobiaceae bacterium]